MSNILMLTGSLFMLEIHDRVIPSRSVPTLVALLILAEHDRITGGDHAPDGVRRRLEHDAVLRRPDVGALELILGRHLALDEFADLAVDLAQLLGGVARLLLVDLEDLQLGLDDLALASAAAAISWPRSPYRRATTPELNGTVARISADTTNVPDRAITSCVFR
jgi:hypothetical protein